MGKACEQSKDCRVPGSALLCVADKGFGRWLAKDGGGAWASCASRGARCGRERPGSAGRRVAASVLAASAAARWVQGKPQHPSPAWVPAVTLPRPGHSVVLLPSGSIQATVSGSVFVCIQGRFAYGLMADKEWKKRKLAWFWSAVLSKASGVLQPQHNSNEGFTPACTQHCSLLPEGAVSTGSETVGLLQLSGGK